MADKEINDLTDGGAAVAGDLVHVVRSGNSRKVALKAQLPTVPASSAGPASMEFAEDTDSGSNKVTLQAPAALASDVAVTLPSAAGTLALTSDIPSVPVATQSDQETATSTTAFVTPGRQQFHPSAAKFWGFVTLSGGTPTLASSYNVSGITDTGVGRLTPAIGTDFSSANWSSWLTITATTGGVRAGKIAPSTKAAGSVEFTCVDNGGSGADPDAYDFGGFGDQ